VRKSSFKWLSRAGLICGGALGFQAAFALNIYHYNIDNGPFALHDVVLLSQLDLFNATGINFGPNNTDPFNVAAGGHLTINSHFTVNGQGATTVGALLMGIAQDLPGDAPGQKHAVVMMNDAAANAAAGIDWGTLFPNTDEDQLISDIENSVSGATTGFTGMSDYFHGDAQTGIHSGSNVLSAWFTPGDHFTIETWSGGQIIGSGTSSVTSVPEPATMAVLGLGVVGVIRRRRRA
jgi:hypothetical protein